MFDLAKFEAASEEGAVLELRDPAGNPLLQDDEARTPVTIRLSGVESPRWTKAADVLANKINESKEKRMVQDIRVDRAHLLAAITLGWDGVIVDGQVLECSFENAKKLYTRFKWLMEQVDTFVGNRKNFLPASSTS